MKKILLFSLFTAQPALYAGHNKFPLSPLRTTDQPPSFSPARSGSPLPLHALTEKTPSTKRLRTKARSTPTPVSNALLAGEPTRSDGRFSFSPQEAAQRNLDALFAMNDTSSATTSSASTLSSSSSVGSSSVGDWLRSQAASDSLSSSSSSSSSSECSPSLTVEDLCSSPIEKNNQAEQQNYLARAEQPLTRSMPAESFSHFSSESSSSVGDRIASQSTSSCSSSNIEPALESFNEGEFLQPSQLSEPSLYSFFLSCGICSQDAREPFPTRKLLNDHIEDRHTDPSYTIGIKCFICEFNAKNSIQRYTKHLVTTHHIKPFICIHPDCQKKHPTDGGKKFTLSSTLNEHHQLVHFKNKKTKNIKAYCTICNQSLNNFSEFNRHIEKNHDPKKLLTKEFIKSRFCSSTKRYSCPECSCTTTRRQYLKIHIISKHLESKTIFGCAYLHCTKKYSAFKDLNFHFLNHTLDQSVEPEELGETISDKNDQPTKRQKGATSSLPVDSATELQGDLLAGSTPFADTDQPSPQPHAQNVSALDNPRKRSERPSSPQIEAPTNPSVEPFIDDEDWVLLDGYSIRPYSNNEIPSEFDSEEENDERLSPASTSIDDSSTFLRLPWEIATSPAIVATAQISLSSSSSSSSSSSTSHSTIPQDPSSCEGCPKLSYKHLKKHIIRSHSGENGIQCKFLLDKKTRARCNQLFRNKPEFYTHYKYHGNLHFICPQCGDPFPKKIPLIIHEQKHLTDMALIPCPICKSSIKGAQPFVRHIMSSHVDNKEIPCPFILNADDSCNVNLLSLIQQNLDPSSFRRVGHPGRYGKSALSAHLKMHIIEKHKPDLSVLETTNTDRISDTSDTSSSSLLSIPTSAIHTLTARMPSATAQSVSFLPRSCRFFGCNQSFTSVAEYQYHMQTEHGV